MSSLQFSHGRYYIVDKNKWTPVARSKKQADKLWHKYEENKEAGKLGLQKKLPAWQPAVKEYLNYCKANKSEATCVLEKRVIEGYSEVCNPSNLGDFNAQGVERYKGHIRAKGRVFGGINRDLNVLKAMASIFTAWGYFKDNPLKGVKWLPSGRTKKIRYLSPQEIDRLKVSVVRRTPKTILYLGLYAGLRVAEMITLRWEDIDFRQDTITICEKGGWKPKTFQLRTIPLHPELKEYLQSIRKERKGEFIFEGRNGKQKDIRNSSHSFTYAACRPLGIKDFSTHGLRHTFSAYMLFNGCDLWTLSKMLGHSSVSTTEDYYAHLVPGHLQKAITRLNFTQEKTPPLGNS